MLRKNWGLTAAVLLTLTLGIGATTAVYTIVYATLMAPLPYPHPEQLVIVWSHVQGYNNGMSAGDFLDWKRESHSFQQLAAWTGGSFNVATQDEPENLPGRQVTPGYFDLQGIRFQMGRDFAEEEGVPGQDHAVILTHRLWQRLGAKPGILGQPMQINGMPYTVVGVLSAGLADRLGADLMTPLAFTPEQINHDYHWLLTMGRLKPGVTIQQAQADMDGVTARIAAAYPKSNTGWGASVEPFKNDFLPKDRIHNLWLLLGAVGFVLLITCVNIANLLLAKGASRQREIAIRGAVGATRGTVFAQFLTESLMLAVVGGGLGIAAGAGLVKGILAIVPRGILPSEADFALNTPVLLTALGVTTLAGLIFGCAPAWYASRVDPAESMKDGARTGTATGSHKLRRLLIVSEFGLALALLAGAGLAIHSFWNLSQRDLGVRTDHVLTFGLGQPKTRFHSPEEMYAYSQQMLRTLQGVPGVMHAALVTGMPLEGTSDGMPFSMVGGRTYADPSQRPGTGFQSVSPDYFKTFGIELVKGRAFTDQDTPTSVRVAMVNQEFANRYLKGMDPFKKRIAMEQIIPGAPKLGPVVEWQIVGIFHNVMYGNDYGTTGPEMDVPFAQSLAPSFSIGVQTGNDPAAMAKTIATAVHGVDSKVALARVRTMEDVKQETLGENGFTMRLFASFAGVALLMAAVGIYGLMAFTVSQRTQEMGLRLALGASKMRVTTLVLKEASRLALFGIALGLVGAVVVGRLMQSALYGVGSIDVSVMAIVSVVLLGTAVMASYLPARRAAAVEPMKALRTE
jgi:putative ABC transport system permease protein